MPKRDLYSNVDVAVSTVPATYTADGNGTAVDLRGSDAAMVIVSVGVEGDTLSSSVTIEVKLQDSDDNSTWADVDADYIQGSDTDGRLLFLDDPDEAPTTVRRGYLGDKRYIRTTLDIGGTHSTGTEICTTVVRGNLSRRPAA